MAIKSYLAYPHAGRKDELILALSQLSGCDIIPAENKDVIVLVTETISQQQDDRLKEQLDTISSLKLLTMVSGFNAPKN